MRWYGFPFRVLSLVSVDAGLVARDERVVQPGVGVAVGVRVVQVVAVVPKRRVALNGVLGAEYEDAPPAVELGGVPPDRVGHRCGERDINPHGTVAVGRVSL